MSVARSAKALHLTYVVPAAGKCYAAPMRLAMLEMMSALQMNAFRLEVLADEMTEASNELADDAGGEVVRDMARRHRVQAMELKAQFAGLGERYAEQYGGAWEL